MNINGFDIDYEAMNHGDSDPTTCPSPLAGTINIVCNNGQTTDSGVCSLETSNFFFLFFLAWVPYLFPKFNFCNT